MYTKHMPSYLTIAEPLVIFKGDTWGWGTISSFLMRAILTQVEVVTILLSYNLNMLCVLNCPLKPHIQAFIFIIIISNLS